MSRLTGFLNDFGNAPAIEALTFSFLTEQQQSMGDDPPKNNLHRYWPKKPPDAAAPAEDSTQGMLLSRLVFLLPLTLSLSHPVAQLVLVSSSAQEDFLRLAWSNSTTRVLPPRHPTNKVFAPPIVSPRCIFLPAATPPSLISLNWC